MNHLDEGTIHAWLDGALDAARGAEVQAHVDACADCAANVAEARGLVAGASRILLALDDTPSGVIPKRAPAVAPPTRARRTWRAAPWVSSIAAAVVLFALWRSTAMDRTLTETAALRSLDSIPAVSSTPSAEVSPPIALPAPPRATLSRRVRVDTPAVALRRDAEAQQNQGRGFAADESRRAAREAPPIAPVPVDSRLAMTPDLRENFAAAKSAADSAMSWRGCYSVARTPMETRVDAVVATAVGAVGAVANAGAGARSRAAVSSAPSSAAPAPQRAEAPAKALADRADVARVIVRVDSDSAGPGSRARYLTPDSTQATLRAVGRDSVRVVTVGWTAVLARSDRVACPQ
jgi:hypothetical protein